MHQRFAERIAANLYRRKLAAGGGEKGRNAGQAWIRAVWPNGFSPEDQAQLLTTMKRRRGEAG